MLCTGFFLVNWVLGIFPLYWISSAQNGTGAGARGVRQRGKRSASIRGDRQWTLAASKTWADVWAGSRNGQETVIYGRAMAERVSATPVLLDFGSNAVHRILRSEAAR